MPQKGLLCVTRRWRTEWQFRTFLLVGMFALTNTANAGQLAFVANGWTYHFDRDLPRNERNWGGGFYYSFTNDKRYNGFVTASTFKDSSNHSSNYVGGGFQHRFELNQIDPNSYWQVGIMAFAMTRKSYRNGEPFIAALPFASIGNKKFAVNLTYIPDMAFNESALVFVQFAFTLAD